jgi:hypothetical protein
MIDNITHPKLFEDTQWHAILNYTLDFDREVEQPDRISGLF